MPESGGKGKLFIVLVILGLVVIGVLAVWQMGLLPF
jgi:hypothetical protein